MCFVCKMASSYSIEAQDCVSSHFLLGMHKASTVFFRLNLAHVMPTFNVELKDNSVSSTGSLD